MANIYIAGPLYAAEMARELAAELRELDHKVVSTWHDDPKSTVEGEGKLTHVEKEAIGWACASEIRQACTMVVIYDAPGGRSGHVWEAGYFAGRHPLLSVFAIPFNEHSSVPCVFMHSHATLLRRELLLEYLS